MVLLLDFVVITSKLFVVIVALCSQVLLLEIREKCKGQTLLGIFAMIPTWCQYKVSVRFIVLLFRKSQCKEIAKILNTVNVHRTYGEKLAAAKSYGEDIFL